MVKSKQIYSPQNFVCEVTGKCYIFNCDNTAKEIHELLRQNKIETKKKPLLDFQLDEIEYIVKRGFNVVLVDVSGFKGDEWITEYRWFEVPEWFEEGMYDEDEEV
jgi:hypothetical protein